MNDYIPDDQLIEAENLKSPIPQEQLKIGFWRAFMHDKKLFYSTLGVVGFVILAVILISYFIFGRKTSPPPPDLQMNIESPSRIVPSEPFDFEINFSNRSGSTLEDLELSLVYPQGFTFRKSNPTSANDSGRVFMLSDLSAGQTDEVVITGLLDGQVGDRRELYVGLNYKIKGHRTVYQTEKTYQWEIGSPNLTLSIIGPTEAVTGQEVIYNISSKNISDEVLRNVDLNLVAPTEFQITESTPPLAGNRLWFLGDIAPGRESAFRVKGVFGQASAIERVIEVVAALQGADGTVISRAFVITQLDNAPLLITQRLSDGGDDVVLPGENVNYKVAVENTGSATLTNLVVSTRLEGSAYRLSTVKTQGGILTDRTVTWTPGGINALKALRPGGTVEVSFSVEIASPATITREKSMSVNSRPQVTSFEIKEPIIGSDLTLKIKTQTDHIQEVAYESGSLPMRPGQETNFRVTWRLTNTSNTVNDAIVKANLPLGAESFVRGETSFGNISFQATAYEVVWNVGTVEPHSTALAYFIISYTPSVSDVGTAPTLANEISFQAFDNFVNQQVFDETPVGPARAPGRVEN